MSPPALLFPQHGDPDFAGKLADLEEYRIYAAPPVAPLSSAAEFEDRVRLSCSGFEKAMYQHLMQHYLSRRSPYRSILLFHGLGVGKTCSSITIAESFLHDHRQGMPPRILVVSPLALRRSYDDQIFSVAKFLENDPELLKNQCTGDTYARLIHGNPSKELFLRRVQTLIRSRYHFITYDALVNYVEEHPKVSDMVIIIDEAHNLRNQDTEKKAADALEKLLQNGERNRLVLLSATPMYNEPDEILWLLQLLLKNDKRKVALPSTLFKKSGTLEPKAVASLRQLSQEYISYIRGKNPFVFATRVSPQISDVPIVRDEWALPIEDGIVATNIGVKQKDGGVVDETTAKRAGSSPKQLQWLNITYPGNTHGEKGFDKMFQKNGDPFPVAYRATHANKLMPIPGKLDAHAAKLARICDMIRSAEGIVLVYSQFVWSGVIPLAIALEHMGFRRHGGTDLLQNAALVPNPATYPDAPMPQYCILSGDASVMGSSKIETLRRVINAPDNSRGQRIKVVLITPVASEGLSFQNVREVHIMDPWYHLNRIEQVIGRAIRTCSHVSLPLEERNVSVFLHACTTQGEKDSADIHAFKIAARKWKQTKDVEAIIRNSAMDCSLQYHMNFLPKELFNFEVAMRTSQRRLFRHGFGDGDDLKPACGPVEKNRKAPNARTMRSEVYASLIPTTQQRVAKYVRRHLKERVFFKFDELVRAARMKEEIVYEAVLDRVYPRAWIQGYKCHLHNDGIVFATIQPLEPQREVAVPSIKPKLGDRGTSNETTACDPPRLLQSIPISADKDMNTLLFYMFMDSDCYADVVRHVLKHQDNATMAPFLSMLHDSGAIVAKHEVSKIISPNKYVGYADIFDKDMFRVYLQDGDTFRPASDAETRAIKAKRVSWHPPSQDALYGIMEPFKFSKAQDAPLRNTLKLMLPGPTIGKRRGVVCSSNKKKDLVEWLDAIVPGTQQNNTEETKEQLCFSIALQLLKKKQLMLYPEWKVKAI